MSETIALGTVQLGMPYGIANRVGWQGRPHALQVLKAAWDEGIRYFDTAQAYGESESCIGAFVDGQEVSGLRVITKLHPASSGWTLTQVLDSLETSRRNLRRAPWGVMLHREAMLDALDGWLGCALQEATRGGLCGKIGVSVYSMGALRDAIGRADIEMVQAPGSVFDRRLFRGDFLAKAAAAGVTVFIRSVFLQGLVLMEPGDVKQRLPAAEPMVRRYHAFCRDAGVSPLQFAIEYVLRRGEGAIMVLGADEPEQVRANSRMVREARLAAETIEAWDRVCPEDDADIIDPSRWVTEGNR